MRRDALVEFVSFPNDCISFRACVMLHRFAKILHLQKCADIGANILLKKRSFLLLLLLIFFINVNATATPLQKSYSALVPNYDLAVKVLPEEKQIEVNGTVQL